MKCRIIMGLALFFLLSVTEGGAEQPTFSLGIIAPLSGPLAEYGTAVRNGFELARREKPNLFLHFDLKYEDDQYDGKKSIAAFDKLVESDKVDLVYLWGTGPSQAVAPIAETRKIPLVIMSIDPSPALKRRWIIRFGNYSEQYILILLDFLRANGLKKIGILRTELGYMNSMLDALRANLRMDESLTELAVLQPGDSDLKSTIARLSKQKFDALAIYLLPGQISQFYRTAANRHSARLTFGTDCFESMSEAKSAGPEMLGAVFPNNSVEPWFLERYRKEFGNDNQISFAANSYDFAILAAETFGNSESKADRKGIRDRLRAIPPRDGASGRFRYRESDKGGQYFEFPIVIRRVEADGIVTVTQTGR